MASRKLAVLRFIKLYLRDNGRSPSLDEIGVACGIGKTRAHAIVHQLGQEGHIVRGSGVRSIQLPDQIAEALRALRQAGWRINGAELDIDAPEGTKPRLTPQPELDYEPTEAMGGDDDGHGDIDTRGGAAARRA